MPGRRIGIQGVSRQWRGFGVGGLQEALEGESQAEVARAAVHVGDEPLAVGHQEVAPCVGGHLGSRQGEAAAAARTAMAMADPTSTT